MRIAFGSCACLPSVKKQPVWEWIGQAGPDRLLLLGDQIYTDIETPKAPSRMDVNEFAAHLLACYRAQLQQAQFAALLQALGPDRVLATWDDHDFLWNDSCGAAIAAMPTQADKLPITLHAHRDFRAALASGDGLAAFPSDSTGWFATPVPAGPARSLELEPGLWLHLLDARLHRDERTPFNKHKRRLIDTRQRQRVAGLVQQHPGAVHLLASGSTSSDWKRYEPDWLWLLDTAAEARCLLLTGDVHRNECDAFHTGGFPLHEVTSSGLAMRTLVAKGAIFHNHGLLDLSATRVGWQLFHDNVREDRWSRTLDRSTWLPVTP